MDDRSRTLIRPYLGKRVVAVCDGKVFDEQPDIFTLRFANPAELHAELVQRFTGELAMTPWRDLVPVAAVSAPAQRRGEFAWLFLDWRAGSPPAVYVAKTDDWCGRLVAPSIDAIGVWVAP